MKRVFQYLCVLSMLLGLHIGIQATDDTSHYVVEDSLRLDNQAGINILNENEASVYENGNLIFDIDFPVSASKAGDSLSIGIRPDDGDHYLAYKDVSVSQLNDDQTGTKIADVRYDNQVKMILTFADLSDYQEENVHAHFNLPIRSIDAYIQNYFMTHENETSLEVGYHLTINDVATKAFRVKFNRKQLQPTTQVRFRKTLGQYNNNNQFLYNLSLSGQLTRPNYYVIYDTPDINQTVDLTSDQTKLYWSYDIDARVNQIPFKTAKNSLAPTTQHPYVVAYDIYYLTEPSEGVRARQAKYVNEKIKINYNDNYTNQDSKDYMTKPANILFTTLAGSSLTADQQALIDQNGGLNQSVGKGFMLEIFDLHPYKSSLVADDDAASGVLNLVYYTDIVHESQELKNDWPLYHNQASAYGQEIPLCDDTHEECRPIRSEFGHLSAEEPPVLQNREGKQEETSFNAEITNSPKQLKLTKYARINGQLDKSQPLENAVFRILVSDQEKTYHTDQLAYMNDIALDQLKTNQNGQLTANGQPIYLEKGYYFIEEIQAPDNYVLDQDPKYFVAVGARALSPIELGNDPATTTLQVKAIKKVDKGNFKAGDFVFDIHLDPANPALISGIQQGVVQADGQVDFGQWQLTKTGQYHFTITEHAVSGYQEFKPVHASITVRMQEGQMVAQLDQELVLTNYVKEETAVKPPVKRTNQTKKIQTSLYTSTVTLWLTAIFALVSFVVLKKQQTF